MPGHLEVSGGSSGKKGKKKKKKRGAKSQQRPSQFPEPASMKNPAAVSYGKVSSSGNNFTGSYSQNDFEDDVTVSKSLTSLGDLPMPTKPVTKTA